MPLPEVNYINGFTSNGTGTVFTVGATGAYLISYSIILADPVSDYFGIAISVNGVINDNTVIVNEGSTTVDRLLSNTVILNLTAGSTLQLVVFSSNEFTELLNDGVNANLTAVKIA